MPNIIDSSFESATNGQRLSFAADIDFMQYGIRDGDAAIIRGLLGSAYDPSTSYILAGCVKSSSAGTTSITEGLIFGVSKAIGGMAARTYIYSVVAQSFPDPAGADVVVGAVTPYSQAYADPTPFIDIVTSTVTTQDVHNEYRIVWSTGASGSGDVDFDDLVPCKEGWKNLVPTGTDWGPPAGVQSWKYKRDLFAGLVHVQGQVITTGTSAAQVIATLPAGYRPWSGIYRSNVIIDIAGPTTTAVTSVVTNAGDIGFAITAEIPTTTGILANFSFTFPIS